MLIISILFIPCFMRFFEEFREVGRRKFAEFMRAQFLDYGGDVLS